MEKERFNMKELADKLEQESKILSAKDPISQLAFARQQIFVDYQGNLQDNPRMRDEKGLLDSLGQAAAASMLNRIKTIEQLEQELERANNSPNNLRSISRNLHAIDPNYLKIISYFKDMFHTRYVVVPYAAETDDKELDMEAYHKLMNTVDGISLETLVPTILENLYIEGIVGIYFDYDEPTDSVLGTILPASRVRSSFQTMYGTNVVEFDFGFFDSFRGDDLEAALNAFPDEFRTGYAEVSKLQSKWRILDPARSAAIKMNSLGVPPFIAALSGIIEFKDTRVNELKKGKNELKKILINEIPVEDGQPIFEVGEIQDLTRIMRSVLRDGDAVDIITAFGKTELHSLQSEGRAENKRIDQAFATIYSASGVNPAIFSSKTDGAIEASREADKSFVWNAYKQIELILNLVISNLLDGELQARFQFLPITMHGESEAVKIYRENASFGIGKLDAIVASGIRQSDIARRHKLEKALDLDNILVPLQSAHTVSRVEEDINVNKEEEKEPEVDNKEVNEDE